ncbi:InlB B-repeat-containing protein [Treponema denticola]|uniref:InlB B-repeat-containing protein n=1 Tax=Treponema denticola TaxID=158 RepID=UPI002103013C|nr:InlB B-repeat-containing protein [Treponema denticola]UTY22791.1 hypothetical protein E4N78_00355 [Treponema denticola]
MEYRSEISKDEAKLKLEKEIGIEFEYSDALYDENKAAWVFTIKIENAETLLHVSTAEDFIPYLALAEHLNLTFSETLSRHVFLNYGTEYIFGIGKLKNQYCYTEKGWLDLQEIENIFLEKFGSKRKNYSMKDENWAVYIYRNGCFSTSYKKNEKLDWPVSEKIELLFTDLEDKVLSLNTEKIENRIKQNQAEILEADKKTEEREIVPEEDPILYEQSADADMDDAEPELKNSSEDKDSQTYSELNTEYEIDNDYIEEAIDTEEQFIEQDIEYEDDAQVSSELPFAASDININEVEVQNTPRETGKNSYKPLFIVLFLVAFIGFIFIIYNSTQNYKVTFDANGGSGYAPNSIKEKKGNAIILPFNENMYIYGYEFEGWNTRADGTGTTYFAGSRQYFDGNMTLYALWDKYKEKYVHINDLRVRSGPSTDYSINELLKQDKLIKISEKSNSNNFVKARYDGKIGYLNYKYLRDIKITEIKLGNWYNNRWLTNPGDTLTAYNIRYLKPQIKIETCNNVNKEYKFNIKIIEPDGTIKRNYKTSPSGYSYSTTINISGDRVQAISGWGNDQGGTYYSGWWTIEIWYTNPDGINDCIKKQRFYLR